MSEAPHDRQPQEDSAGGREPLDDEDLDALWTRPQPLDDVDLADLMQKTTAKIQELRQGPRPEDMPDQEGEAVDGRIKVVAKAGHVETVTLDPRVMRMPATELADEFRSAVNTALSQGQTEGDIAMPDLAALGEMLRGVQNFALVEMQKYTEGITGAMDRIRERTSVSGDPSPHGLEELFGMAQNNLDDAIKGLGTTEEARGEGTVGMVIATAVIGRVESVEIDQRAMRMPSADLAGQLKDAVNAALDDLKQNARGGPGGVAPEDLSRRVREVQDLSLQQMRTHTRALRDIMESIEGPEQ